MLKVEGRGSTRSGEQARTRRMLVITEFALSLVLMTAATLLLRSFWDLLNVPLGFNPQNVMAVRTRLPDPNDPRPISTELLGERHHFYAKCFAAAERFRESKKSPSGDTASIPLDESLRNLKLISEGQFLFTLEGDIRNDEPPVAERSSVTPEYFHLLEFRYSAAACSTTPTTIRPRKSR